MTIKLIMPGDEVTMLVRSVEQVASDVKVGTFRYKIDGILPDGNEERVYLNCQPVDRQLLSHLRISSAEDMVGTAFRFFRVEGKGGIPAAGYLNIDFADPAAPQSKRLPAPNTASGKGVVGVIEQVQPMNLGTSGDERPAFRVADSSASVAKSETKLDPNSQEARLKAWKFAYRQLFRENLAFLMSATGVENVDTNTVQAMTATMSIELNKKALFVDAQ